MTAMATNVPPGGVSTTPPPTGENRPNPPALPGAGGSKPNPPAMPSGVNLAKITTDLESYVDGAVQLVQRIEMALQVPASAGDQVYDIESARAEVEVLKEVLLRMSATIGKASTWIVKK